MASGLPATVVHLPDFYGPGVVNKLMEPLFLDPVAGKDGSFPGPVDVPHEFIYIDDAAQALLVASGQEKAYGRRYTVSGTAPITVRKLCRLVYQASGTQGKVSGMPPWMLALAGLFNREARAARGIMHVFAYDVRMDGSDLRRDFGFSPQVGYEEGVKRTASWFQEKLAA